MASSRRCDKKTPNRLIQKLCIGRVAGCAGSVSPERWDWRQRDARNKSCFIACVPDRKVEVGFRRHVQERHFDRTQRFLRIAVKSRRASHVVLLPRAHLQDKVVGIRAGNEVCATVLKKLLEGSAWGCTL